MSTAEGASREGQGIGKFSGGDDEMNEEANTMIGGG